MTNKPLTPVEYLTIATRLVNLAKRSQAEPATPTPVRMREVVGDNPTAPKPAPTQPDR